MSFFNIMTYELYTCLYNNFFSVFDIAFEKYKAAKHIVYLSYIYNFFRIKPKHLKYVLLTAIFKEISI